MSVISIRLNKEEQKLFKTYSEYTGKNLSELFKMALKETIEDKIDYEVGLLALEEFEKDKTTYTIDEILEELK